MILILFFFWVRLKPKPKIADGKVTNTHFVEVNTEFTCGDDAENPGTKVTLQEVTIKSVMDVGPMTTTYSEPTIVWENDRECS